LVQGLAEAPVAHYTGQHDGFFPEAWVIGQLSA